MFLFREEFFKIYQIGDQLAHPDHGGCTIRDIKKRDFNGHPTVYFVLSPKSDPDMTILVPVDSFDKIGIRDLISDKEADQILDYFSTVQAQWDNNNKNRKKTYEAAMRHGALEDMAKMIKELRIHERSGTLSSYEKGILPRAQKKLFSEIALVKGMEMESVFRLIDGIIA